ncbi:MAG: bifunctional glutamate N-acetyltransferase/amino-acid acetyltransferase ArgJ [Thermodesulfobacteriota bacterium]
MEMNDKEWTVQGFTASAVAAGIKYKDRLDLGLIFSEGPAVAAGVFTTNQVKAAPVLLSQEHLRANRARAIIVNSGNANACTGKDGLYRARLTAERVAKELSIRPEEVLVASTGVIGAPLNTDAVSASLPALVKGLSPGGIPRVVEAMMTTDSFPKRALFQGEAGGKPFRIIGVAKGAGMIMPDMATMLCFVLSDIRVQDHELKKALASAVQRSFNRITVDGDTSTNDTVFVLANGRAGNGPLSTVDLESFERGLQFVMEELAAMMVRDGEGATKLVRLQVKGAASESDAEKAARTVANSSLVKTAFYGADANWGRIMAALGRSGIRMEAEKTDIWVDEVKIVEAGLGIGAAAEEKAQVRMKGKEFSVTIDLGQGAHEDRILTCDLTHEYVSINANYRT